ncbi:MAG: DUF3313 family protein [Amphiplicatus sp.]
MALMRACAAVAAFIGAAAAMSPAAAFDRENVIGGKQLSSFASVYIAPVALSLEQGRDERPVREKDAARRASDFHDDLVDEFSGAFEIADAPGAGVLTIEATLTKLVATRPTLADFSEQPGLGFESVYAGGAAFSATLSEDGETLAEVGDRHTSSLGDGSPKIATWQDADRAFSQWARQLVDFVEKN